MRHVRLKKKKHILMSFLGGVAAAYWVRTPRLLAWSRTPVAGVIALVVLIAVLTLFRKSFAFLPLLLLTLVFSIIASGHTLFGALALRSIRWMGEISYSTYLLHEAVDAHRHMESSSHVGKILLQVLPET